MIQILDLKRMGDKKYIISGAVNVGLGQGNIVKGGATGNYNNNNSGDDAENIGAVNLGNNNSDDSRNNFNSTNSQFRVKNGRNNIGSNAYISDKSGADDLLGGTSKKTPNDQHNNQN